MPLLSSSPASAQQDTQTSPRLSPRLTPRPRPPTQPSPATSEPTKKEPKKKEPAKKEKAAPAKRSEPQTQAPPQAQQTPPVSRPPSSPPVLPPPVLGVPSEGVFLPPVLSAYKKLPPPPGYVQKRRLNTPLLYGGAATLVLTYGISLIYGGANDFKNGLGGVAVPLIGPWLAIGQRDFNCKVVVTNDIDQSTRDVSKCITREAQAVGVLVGLGIGQLIGGVLLAVGLADQKKTWIRADLAGMNVEFDAQIGPSSTGLVAKGQF